MRFFHFAFLLFSKGGRHFSLFFFGSISEAEWPKEKHQRETLRVNRTRPHTHTHTQAQLPLCSLLSGERERERERCVPCAYEWVWEHFFDPKSQKASLFVPTLWRTWNTNRMTEKKRRKKNETKSLLFVFFLFSSCFLSFQSNDF